MQVVTITDATQYLNLYTLTSISVGTSVVVTNTTNYPLYVQQSSDQPTASSIGDVCEVGEEMLINGRTGLNVWVKTTLYGGPVVVQLAAGGNSSLLNHGFPREAL